MNSATRCLAVLVGISVACHTSDKSPDSTNNPEIDNGATIYQSDLENRSPDTLTGSIHKGLSPFAFRFHVNNDQTLLDSIIIYRGRKKVQVIIRKTELNNPLYELIDWNFDGYNDLSVMVEPGSGGASYAIWNYSPAKGVFIYNEHLSDRMGLERDTVGRYIIIHYRSGREDEFRDTMKYVNDSLVFIAGQHDISSVNDRGQTKTIHYFSKKTKGRLLEWSDTTISN